MFKVKKCLQSSDGEESERNLTAAVRDDRHLHVKTEMLRISIKVFA